MQQQLPAVMRAESGERPNVQEEEQASTKQYR
jgi:hypothetical protein